jgi:hypothetical protein
MNKEQKNFVKSARILTIKNKYFHRKIRRVLKNLQERSFPTKNNEEGN